jgi:hypothetical protein
LTDDNSIASSPTAHLTDLFRRAVRTGLAKGGTGIGPSPLLPWVAGPETVTLDPISDSMSELARPRPAVDPSAPEWLRLACAPADVGEHAAGGIFSLRPISQVGFGFGMRVPW